MHDDSVTYFESFGAYKRIQKFHRQEKYCNKYLWNTYLFSPNEYKPNDKMTLEYFQ